MQTGLIEKLQIQREKKGPFELVPFLELEEGQGIIGDCHYGGGNKQISFLSSDLMQWIRSQQVPGLCFSKLQGNVITRGIDYSEITAGDVIMIENVQIELASYTKQCFTECNRLQQELPCELKYGIAFARVLSSGVIQTGKKIMVKSSVH